MNPHLGVGGAPGMDTEVVMEANVFALDNTHVAIKGVTIQKDTEDPDHTGKETKLQQGLVLVQIVDGEFAGQYTNPDATLAPEYDEDIEAAVILNHPVDMRGKDGLVEKKVGMQGFVHGRVDRALLFYGASDPARIAAIEAVMKLVSFEDVP